MLGIQFVEEGHIVGQRHHEAGTELSEVIEQVERIGAVAQDIGVELDVKLPSAPDFQRGSCRLRDGGLTGHLIVRLHQAMKIGKDGVADDGVGTFRGFDQGANIVLGRQRDRDEILIRPDFAFADPVEGCLEFVREGCDGVEAEHRARTLDGMQRAEGRVDKLLVVGTDAEIEQRAFEHVEEFTGFLPEDFSRIQSAHDRTSLLTTASSCSCLNGLVIQPVAPAFLASSLTASLDSVVRNTIGRPSKAGNARSARISSSPFITGMFRSVITRSNLLALAFSSPWAPSPASITLWPAGASVTLII